MNEIIDDDFDFESFVKTLSDKEAAELSEYICKTLVKIWFLKQKLQILLAKVHEKHEQ